MDKHIRIEQHDKFLKVFCDEGHYITNWDMVDIKDYTFAKIMYCNHDYDISKYYCVTDEEHSQYIAEQEAKAREEDNNRR